MSHKAQILELLKRLDDLPVRQEDLLKIFLVDLKLTIKEIFGPGNQYLDYLKFVKFKPEAVFVTERELNRSWLSGKAQIANLLRVLLNDPLVRGSAEADAPEQAASEEDASIRRFSDIQDSILGALDGFQKEILNRPSAELEEGPLKDPLRKDFFEAPSAVPTDNSQPAEPRPQPRIFVVSGSDQLVNGEVMEFLNTASADVVKKEDDRRRGESLLDQLNRVVSPDFAVFVLSPDFYFYPRTQDVDRARLMAAQEIIFQLGYLVAKLGRERVLVLYQESDHFRRPTDYFDIFYVPMTANAVWKIDLAKRLSACGISVPLAVRWTSVQGAQGAADAV